VASTDLSCREIVELVTDYLEGTLEPADQRAFELHLAECEGCRNYLDQMRKTIRLTGELHQESLPPELQEELVAAFRAWTRRA
jgi:predicted anti-sigma-YlaC factor YlaD